MKRIYTLLAVLSGIAAFSSCNDFLDKIPDQRTELDSEQKLQQLLVTAYPQGSFNMIAECSSDNITDNGTSFSSEYPQIEENYLWKEVTMMTSDTPHELWDACYGAVMTCNTALEFIEKSGNPKEWEKYRAEALICRAYAHFVMVNIFCQHYNEQTSATDLGIPYIETVEKELFVKYERETVKSVYEKIDRDIETALPFIDESYYKVPSYRFNVRAAHAFAARFNLYYMKDLRKVIDYATVALGSDPMSSLRDFSVYKAFSSWGDWGDSYISPDHECNLMLLALPSVWARTHAPYKINRRYTHSPSLSRTETYESLGIWNTQSPDYAYGKLFGSTTSRACYPKIKEYFVVDNPVLQTGRAFNVYALFTTDEILLCRAEAYALLKEYPPALEDLTIWNNTHGTTGNVTQPRVEALYGQYVDFSGTKKEIDPKFSIDKDTFQEYLLHAILHARRIETIGDGLRWFDIKRYGIPIVHQVSRGEPIELRSHDIRYAIQLPGAVIASGMTPNPR